MKIEFTPQKAENFFQSFAEQLDTEVLGNGFIVPKHIGKGSGVYFKIDEQLSLFVYDLSFKEVTTMERKGVPDSNFFPIICWFSYDKIVQETEGEKIILSKDSPYGIFLASPKIDFNYHIPANSRIIVITITFQPDWLKKNITDHKQSKLWSLVDSNKPFAIYEEISFNMSQYLEKLKSKEQEEVVSLIQFRSYVLNFLALFIAGIEKRKNSHSSSNINHQDIEKLFSIRRLLSTEYSSHHKIEDLARDVGMSESKLHKLFKDVFGSTLYQYALTVKIEEAKRMIESKKYSISEVGYKIGYSNLSHFSAAFKKQIGLNPKQYLQKLK